jgi:hypothetical protein
VELLLDRLVAQVTSQPAYPCPSAKCAFWIMNSCPAHRGQQATQRIAEFSTNKFRIPELAAVFNLSLIAL